MARPVRAPDRSPGPGRAIARGPGAVAAALALMAVGTAPPAQGADEVPAAREGAGVEVPRSARRFADSVGVVTHAAYFDTSYADWDRVVEKLSQLGVRHVRDALLADPAAPGTARYLEAVKAAAAAGIRFDFLVSRPDQGGSLDQQLAALKGPLAGTAASVEGPNEPDAEGGTAWPGATRAAQAELHRKVKADPELRSLRVIGPSLVQPASRGLLGDLSGMLDAGNLHPYTGAAPPTQDHLAREAVLAAAVSGSKPLWATEVGFHNALAAMTNQPPVSERAAAIYILRTVLEHFEAGIVRTFAYELLDEKPDPALTDAEQHFGLLRNDFSAKPAFTSLADLLAAVAPRAGWEGGGPEPPGVRVEDGPGRVRRLLLRQGPDRFSLVLWREDSIWDREARRDLFIAPRDVRVRSAGMTDAVLTRPALERDGRPLAVDGDVARLAVGDDPVVLTWRARPAAADGDGGSATAPPQEASEADDGGADVLLPGVVAGLGVIALAALLARRRYGGPGSG